MLELCVTVNTHTCIQLMYLPILILLCLSVVSFPFSGVAWWGLESGVMPKQKRRYTGASANKDVLAVYHKLVEVVENLALLVEAQPLTDTIVLQVL